MFALSVPVDPAHVSHHFGEALTVLEHAGKAEVNVGGRGFRMKKSFFEDL